MKYISTVFLYIVLSFSAGLNGQTEIAFQYYERLIFFNVKVNNTDSLLFLFDTGANASAIDINTSDQLKLKTVKSGKVEGSAGTIVVPSVRVKSFSLGKSKVKNLVVTKYDLSGSLAPPGHKLKGILGTDFLKHFIVTIDFKKQTIRFSKKLEGNFSDYIPFEMDNNIPRIKSSFNQKVSSYLRYDSGSSLFETKDIYINTTTAIFNELKLKFPALSPAFNLSATGVGGSISIPVYHIDELKLGEIIINKPYLIVQPEEGYFARKDAVGFFGNNLMEKFELVILDFLHNRLYLKNRILDQKK